MPIGIGGSGNYTFWARESTWGNAAVAMPVTGTAVHQPFNSMKTIPVPNIGYENVLEYLANSKNPALGYTGKIDPVDVSYETFFRDPFLLLTMFPNKTVSGAANWGAGNTGTITGDFTADTYADSVMVQVHEDDSLGAEDLDYTYLGGKINKYSWYCEPGKLLMERFTVKMMNWAPQVRTFSADANFDDGTWGDWDQDGPFHGSVCSLEWNGSAIADIDIKSWEFIVYPEQNMEHIASQLYAGVRYDGKIKCELHIKGFMTGNTLKTQYLTAYASKTMQTMEAIYNNAGGAEERKMQCTNMILDKLNYDEIPEPGSVLEVEAIFVGAASSAVSYSGKWTSHYDPHASPNRINCVAR